MQNFTAIPNPASYFGYNHLSRIYSALRNAMIETLKMPKIAKLPRLNSANDAQNRKKFRFVQEIGPQSRPGQEKQNVPPRTLWKNKTVFFWKLDLECQTSFFFTFFFQAIRLRLKFSNLSQEFEQNGIFGIYPKFFFQDLCVYLC